MSHLEYYPLVEEVCGHINRNTSWVKWPSNCRAIMAMACYEDGEEEVEEIALVELINHLFCRNDGELPKSIQRTFEALSIKSKEKYRAPSRLLRKAIVLYTIPRH